MQIFHSREEGRGGGGRSETEERNRENANLLNKLLFMFFFLFHSIFFSIHSTALLCCFGFYAIIIIFVVISLHLYITYRFTTSFIFIIINIMCRFLFAYTKCKNYFLPFQFQPLKQQQLNKNALKCHFCLLIKKK